MTPTEQRARLEESIKFFEDEKSRIREGIIRHEPWAINRGADDAFDILADLVTAYRRMIKISAQQDGSYEWPTDH